MTDDSSIQADSGLKLVLAGPVGAGKTTTLTSLADTPPVSTEMPLAEDEIVGDKTTTTVALDFSTVFLDDGVPLQLFGLPGQEHLGHMRQIVLNGAVGTILLLPGDDPAITDYCTHWMAAIYAVDPDIPIVIGVTKTDISPEFRMDTLREALDDNTIPIFTIDARDRDQASQLVRALLLLIS